MACSTPLFSSVSAKPKVFEPRSRLVLTSDKPAGAVGVMESPMRGLPGKASGAKAERLQSAATLHHNSRNILQLRGLRLFLMHFMVTLALSISDKVFVYKKYRCIWNDYTQK